MKVPAKATRVSPEEMITALRAAWTGRHHTTPKPESIAICLAQWAHETARGIYMKNFNVGNVKAWSTDVPHCYVKTWEMVSPEKAAEKVAASTPEKPCYIDGNGHAAQQDKVKLVVAPEHPDCRFRAFGSLDEGCSFYLQFIEQRFARAWDMVVVGDLESFVIKLKQGNYFTDALDLYLRSMKNHYPLYFDLASDTIRIHTVRGAQMALKKLGFDPGDIDDMPGPKTTKALLAYQKSRKLLATGRRDDDTKLRLCRDLGLPLPT